MTMARVKSLHRLATMGLGGGGLPPVPITPPQLAGVASRGAKTRPGWYDWRVFSLVGKTGAIKVLTTSLGSWAP